MAKAKSKELANIDEQLAAEAASIADNIGKPSSNIISVKGKVFKLPDGQIFQEPLRVVIVDFVSKNFYYGGERYDESNPSPAVCFAQSAKAGGMTPSENADDIQADACEACPMNEFGSDGKGKACKNHRFLAVMLPDIDDDDQLYTLKVSPTAIKSFDAYVGSIAKMFNAPPVKVITEVSFHPDKSYPLVLFGNPQPNTDVAAHFARREDAREMLMVEPSYQKEEEEKTTGRKASTKKKTTRRRS